MKKHSVLFVCTGNICRSSTAEGVFRHYARQKDMTDRFLIDSAGTHGYHVGEPPDSRAVAVALARDIKIDDLRARCIAVQDFHDFDFILAMDQGHFDILSGMMPAGGNANISLFMDYAPQAGRADVPDPYYGTQKDFEYVLDLAEQGAEGLLTHLG